jgi:hypothetical protein
MAMPSTVDIQNAKSKVAATKRDVKDDQQQIEEDRRQIQDLDDEIQGLKKGLPAKELAREEAKAEAKQLLEQIEQEIELAIQATDSSVLQGGKATFQAVYDKSGLPTGNLTADLGVQLLWDTSGCSIITGNVHSEEITVDTSTVQPGDYGISVSLTFV